MSDDSVRDLAHGRNANSFQMDGIECKIEGNEPLKTLMTAVLVRAIEDFHGQGQTRREAARYLFTMKHDHEAVDYLFSFSSICECLQLDINNLRKKIMGMQNKLRMRRRVA